MPRPSREDGSELRGRTVRLDVSVELVGVVPDRPADLSERRPDAERPPVLERLRREADALRGLSRPEPALHAATIAAVIDAATRQKYESDGASAPDSTFDR